MRLTTPSIIATFLSSTASAYPAVAAQVSRSHVTQLLEISNTFVENIAFRRNGQILLNTIGQGEMYSYDPLDAAPTPRVVAQVEGVTALTGIAEVGTDVFAITGTIYYKDTGSFEPGSLKVAVVDFSKCGQNQTTGDPSVKIIIEGVNVALLNGMTHLPQHKHIVLSAGSETGQIWRIDTAHGSLELAFQDEQLAPTSGASGLGVNGLKIFNGHLYFTNTQRQTFGRVKIDEYGSKTGDVEIIAQLPLIPDDFIIDRKGNAFLTAWPNTIFKVTPDGKEIVIVTDTLVNPTSVALGKDQKTLYVTTAGQSTEPVTGGQLVEIKL